jgi:hypothetical protein
VLEILEYMKEVILVGFGGFVEILRKIAADKRKIQVRALDKVVE